MWPFLKHLIFGWPKRYWLIETPYTEMRVVRACFAPSYSFTEEIKRVLDGPFDTNDDAARALSFWRKQYAPSKQEEAKV